MIEKGNLSSFNQERNRDLSLCNDNELTEIIAKNMSSFPLIALLLTETTKFYSQYFPELQDKIKREKRLVVFETPSRVQMTHEYTLEGIGQMKQGFYYLFNATGRLSWLKVYLEEKRIAIASKEKVVLLLLDKLGDELGRLESFLNQDKMTVVSRLYDAADGKPCFVEFNQKEYKGQQSLLLSLTFFDSIQNKVLIRGERILSPLQEKLLTYNYNTLSKSASAWIYLKAPSNFVLSVENNATTKEIEKSESNDEEISSFVLIPSGMRLNVQFDISVNVPKALSCWYKTMFYSSILITCINVFFFAFSFYHPISKEIVEILNNISLAIVAALIATRGWLISEEQVMKKVSNSYAILVVILLAMLFGMTITSHLVKYDNTLFDGHESCPLIIDTIPQIAKDTVEIQVVDSLLLKSESN